MPLKYLKFPRKDSNEGNVSKFLKFLLTARGRGIVRYTVGTVTLGLSAAIFLKETYFIENYIDLVQALKHGFPWKVPDEFKAKIDACLSKAKFDAKESNFVKSFMLAYDFDTKSVGSINSGFGGYIGIPVNYLYETTNDVDKQNIQMKRESIDWNSKYGKLLEKSLVLTEDEKEFGLLKAAFELRNNNYIHRSLIPFGSICTLYILSHKVNQHLDLYQKRPIRFFAYTIFGTVIYGIYSVLTDNIQIRQDIKVDKMLAELGPEMCESGVRFYEKLMNRNVAYRELSGDHSTFTVKGNEESGWLRWSTLALSARKLYFQKMLDEARKMEAVDAEKTTKQSKEIDDKVKT